MKISVRKYRSNKDSWILYENQYKKVSLT